MAEADGPWEKKGRDVRGGKRDVSAGVQDLLPLFQEGCHMKERRQAVDRKIISIPLSPKYHRVQCEHKSADSDKAYTQAHTHTCYFKKLLCHVTKLKVPEEKNSLGQCPVAQGWANFLICGPQ